MICSQKSNFHVPKVTNIILNYYNNENFSYLYTHIISPIFQIGQLLLIIINFSVYFLTKNNVMNMSKSRWQCRRILVQMIWSILALLPISAKAQLNSPSVEVTGSATINIVPDRITIEIGMEEYYKPKTFGDSTVVKISEIEKKVRRTLAAAGVPDSLITVTDMGNYRKRELSTNFLMAKRISAQVTSLEQIEKISDNLERRGITGFHIIKIDNSDLESYNRRGLKAALDAAREKAEFIMNDIGGKSLTAWEIVETGPNYYDTPQFSNVSFDSGSGIENMRHIVRRYSVKVTYIINF